MEIKLRKAEGLNKSKKGRQNTHHKETHKYEKQKVRTAHNKARNIKKGEALYATSHKNETE